MMKDLIVRSSLRTALRRHLGRVLGASERCFGPLSAAPGPRATMDQEMRLGAAVGLAACLFYAWLAGASAQALLGAGLAGFSAGAVIGLVLWNSSSELPEDPVLPPARGQERRGRAPALRSLVSRLAGKPRPACSEAKSARKADRR